VSRRRKEEKEKKGKEERKGKEEGETLGGSARGFYMRPGDVDGAGLATAAVCARVSWSY